MDEEFTEAVLSVVEQIPEGSVATYGLIAERLGRGGARQVGRVMSLHGQAVPWWRVVRANGTLPAHLMIDAQQYWRDEGTPVRNGHVVVKDALAPGF